MERKKHKSLAEGARRVGRCFHTLVLVAFGVKAVTGGAPGLNAPAGGAMLISVAAVMEDDHFVEGRTSWPWPSRSP